MRAWPRPYNPFDAEERLNFPAFDDAVAGEPGGNDDDALQAPSRPFALVFPSLQALSPEQRRLYLEHEARLRARDDAWWAARIQQARAVRPTLLSLAQALWGC